MLGTGHNLLRLDGYYLIHALPRLQPRCLPCVPDHGPHFYGAGRSAMPGKFCTSSCPSPRRWPDKSARRVARPEGGPQGERSESSRKISTLDPGLRRDGDLFSVSLFIKFSLILSIPGQASGIFCQNWLPCHIHLLTPLDQQHNPHLQTSLRSRQITRFRSVQAVSKSAPGRDPLQQNTTNHRPASRIARSTHD